MVVGCCVWLAGAHPLRHHGLLGVRIAVWLSVVVVVRPPAAVHTWRRPTCSACPQRPLPFPTHKHTRTQENRFPLRPLAPPPHPARLLPRRCVPFLPPEPASRYSLDLIPVSYVMHCPVICLRPQMTVRAGGRGRAWVRARVQAPARWFDCARPPGARGAQAANISMRIFGRIPAWPSASA